jgi:hypothetical protein
VAWWWWVLLWVVVLSFSAGVFFLLGLSLWRKAKALGRELGAASERLAAATESLTETAETAGPAKPSAGEPSVFSVPSQLRQERILAGRRRDGKHSAIGAQQLRAPSTRQPGQRVR